MNQIVDMQNYIRTRQRKGRTGMQILDDLMAAGYDRFAAEAFVMQYWEETKKEN